MPTHSSATDEVIAEWNQRAAGSSEPAPAGGAGIMDEWKNVSGTPVYSTLEEWIVNEAKGGQKFETVMFIAGNLMRATIRWSDGTRHEIRVGEREPGQVCVLARRTLEEAAS